MLTVLNELRNRHPHNININHSDMLVITCDNDGQGLRCSIDHVIKLSWNQPVGNDVSVIIMAMGSAIIIGIYIMIYQYWSHSAVIYHPL